ncbi:SDR family NAD(P)-dependent oxidoreductase [Mesorhizobium sp. BR1-1-16]|uniref:SDR family NAD(P)-dependent oxidoreductase n=1 Tax=Mesorhizobium sp. BR1-1-16 TaxID=2876653 RepID=UPI001CCC2720|nr:SDR family NAD(P)-dependent oxidoreductase [Mesorhizobium sp. BR1-1-16]MBZ9935557.1 SDR family NAD(P)-dependent oxidoreductase [Mesorhizobium sp. BR1-1-16]
MTEETRIALVTGANQGIGLQIAKDLAARGLTVLLGSRDLGRGKTAAQSVTGNVHAIQLDVTDDASIRAAVAQVEETFGRLDILINNAAISRANSLESESMQDYTKRSRATLISVDEVRTIWETNVFGVLAVTQAFVPLLRKSRAARIVNVSSGLGSLTTMSTANPYRAIFNPGYAASKTALNAITIAFAIDLEDGGIKVNAVTPGFTSTALNNYEGTETVEQGAAEAVRVALLGSEGPTGTFTASISEELPW